MVQRKHGQASFRNPLRSLCGSQLPEPWGPPLFPLLEGWVNGTRAPILPHCDLEVPVGSGNFLELGESLSLRQSSPPVYRLKSVPCCNVDPTNSVMFPHLTLGPSLWGQWVLSLWRQRIHKSVVCRSLHLCVPNPVLVSIIPCPVPHHREGTLLPCSVAAKLLCQPMEYLAGRLQFSRWGLGWSPIVWQPMVSAIQMASSIVGVLAGFQEQWPTSKCPQK